MTESRLYVVTHEIDGERYMSPCVGDDELKNKVNEAERFGAELKDVLDVEAKLYRFVWDCCFEGLMQGWNLRDE